MEKIVINGGRKLYGELSVNGAKNAAVAIIPAAIMANDISIIENIPYIEDVLVYIEMLNKVGAKCTPIGKHTLRVDGINLNTCTAPYESVKKIRASCYLMGAFLGRFGKAEVAFPGGCNFGDRPIDQHIRGFEQMSANVYVEHGMVKIRADKLLGTAFYFDTVSVGATINLMLAATLADGVTVLENAAKEPHVVDTANFLNSMGANIKGAGTDIIRITGVEGLHGSQYMIIPDQIEAGTYMIAAAIAGGDVLITDLIPKHMDSLVAKLIDMGVEITEYDDAIRIVSPGGYELNSVNIKTMPYPGFPTDLQPQMAALLSVARGSGVITENIFGNRFQYINELKRLGANINVEGKVAILEECSGLTGAEVSSTDLRAGVAMILAGLAAQGDTIVNNIKYIDRGYENLVEKLRGVGANIERVSFDDEVDK